ncbi:MAG TPA: hydantoinase/oxoprolinase family protein, partial [Burkholderiales bacterium]|nr:hydantoinase/oxoprolinase family protein [Burkholderiales bacterium]
AAGIFKVAASQMAEAIRFVSVQRGVDARDFDLCVFGGGGPIHGFSIAEELGMRRIVVPSNPGLFSASGIAVADFTHDYSMSILKPAAGIDLGLLHKAYEQLRARADVDFDTEGVPPERRHYQRSSDMRYVGQSTEINIRVAADDSSKPVALGAWLEEFHRQHESVYTYSVPDEPVEIVNIRLRVLGLVDKPKKRSASAGGRSAKPIGTREVWFSRNIQTKVFLRNDLGPGIRIAGPAIIQELSSATIVPPGATASVDPQENILLELP